MYKQRAVIHIERLLRKINMLILEGYGERGIPDLTHK
jgi:hypothetical protein